MNNREIENLRKQVDYSSYDGGGAFFGFVDDEPIDEEKLECDLHLLQEEIDNSDDSYYSDDTVRDYLKAIGKYPLLDKEEERELLFKAKNGDEEARDKLINCNLRLVVSVAKKYTNRGVEFLDLIQEGNIGLMETVDKFDLSRDVKFSTYAYEWIRQKIVRSIQNDGRLIRITVHFYEEVTQYMKYIRNYLKDNGRYPTEQEIMDGMRIDLKKLRAYRNVVENQPISISTPVSKEEDNVTIESSIEDRSANFEDRLLDSMMFYDFLEDAFNSLKPRERDIFIRRRGLETGVVEKLAPLSEYYHVSDRRINQIEQAAAKKIEKKAKTYKYVDMFYH